MSTTLKAAVREKLGSRWAKRLRLQNRIPCSVQGEGKDNVDFSIDADEFNTARRNHEHLFQFEMDKGGVEDAMIRELQWDTLSQTVIHVEFRRVVLGQMTETEVELEFLGQAKGGVLNYLHTHVTIRCLPRQIPDSIEVRADSIEQGKPLLAKDLVLPEGAELAMDGDTQIALVSEVKAEVEPTEGEEGAEGAEAAAPAPDAPSE